MTTEKYIELTFKVVMILASLGLVVQLIRKVFSKVRTVIFWGSDISKRVTALENKIKTRKRKKSIKKN